MQIEEREIVYDATTRPPGERVASFTSLCVADSGAVFCSFQVGTAKHSADTQLVIMRSRDEGRSWQQLNVRFAHESDGVRWSCSTGEIVEVERGRLLLISTWFDRRDPTLPLFNPVTEGILPSKQLAAFSTDEGDTWTALREIPIPVLKGCTSTGPILKWSDGAIAYPFESYKEFHDVSPGKHGAWFIVSRDHGKTFEPPVLVAQDPRHRIYYWDQRLCVGANPGEFVGLFWTHDLDQKKDLNVHLRKASAAGESLHDAPVTETTLPGQIAAPLWLHEKLLLAFVVDRSRPGTLSLWRSADQGVTWPKQLVVHRHDEQAALSQGKENIDFAQYWEDMGKWSFGHPAIRSLKSDKVGLVYYAGVPGCLSIHWARIARAE